MTTDKSTRNFLLLCWLSTALIIICNLVAPVCLFLWFGAATPRQQDIYGMDVLFTTVLCCGAGMLASLIMAVIAKLKEPASKWAVVNIVISSVLLITGILTVLITVWAASQYQYHYPG